VSSSWPAKNAFFQAETTIHPDTKREVQNRRINHRTRKKPFPSKADTAASHNPPFDYIELRKGPGENAKSTGEKQRYQCSKNAGQQNEMNAESVHCRMNSDFVLRKNMLHRQ